MTPGPTAGRIGTLPPVVSPPNPKPETRNPREIRIPKPESPTWLAGQQPVGESIVSDFGLRPSFELRFSAFGFQAPQTNGAGEKCPARAPSKVFARFHAKSVEDDLHRGSTAPSESLHAEHGRAQIRQKFSHRRKEPGTGPPFLRLQSCCAGRTVGPLPPSHLDRHPDTVIRVGGPGIPSFTAQRLH